jgi:hypothetical protein
VSNANGFLFPRHAAPLVRGWLACALAAAALLLAPAGAARAADRTPFDHLTTGFELLGQHRDLPCESCHVNAIFKGTPKDCAACHGVGTAVRATAKPVSHILSSNRCEACHTPVAWNPAVNFDHAEVRGACSSCHNNVQAQGKGPGHIDTSLECDLCHTTIGWAGAVFDHKNVTTGCSRCHNGIGAKGAPSAHIPTGASPNAADPGNAPCEACHTPTNYTSFAGTAMNHPAVSPPMLCADCHEKGMSFYGVSIVTRPVTVKGVAHPTSGECGNCHTSTVSFAIGNLQPAGHIPTTQPCTLCHQNPADYTQKIMDHTGITGGCALCHAAGLSFPNMAPLVLVTTPANHIAFAGAACESCHSKTNFTSPGGFSFTNASGTAPPAMVHSAVSSLACSSCHGAGLSFVGAPPTVTLPTPHVPLAGAECGACHVTNTFKFANQSGTAPPSMVHTAVTGIKCSSCHENTMTSWPGVPPTVLRPATESNGATHPVSGECSDCHASTVSFNGASNFPANHIPLTNGTNSNCSTCHTNANDYSVYAMDVAGHALVSGVCSTCHAAGKSFANMAPPKLVQPPTNHVPFGTAACESCHSNASFATGGFKFTNASGTAPPAMVHTAVGSAACSSCHAKGKSWAGAPPTVVEPVNHIPIGSTACTNCHAASNFTSFVIANAVPPMNHAGFSSGCATCHGSGKTDVGVNPKVTVTLPSNHVPVGSIACEGCHSNSAFTTFSFTNASGTAPSSMVHSLVTSTACSTCHEKGKTWVGTPATVVRPALKADGNAHSPTGECSTCHLNTTSFKGASDLPSGHIPLPAADNGNCGLCHLDANTYSTATMNHVNIASNCAQCHAANLTFAGTWTTPLVSPPANHVPFGTAACESCHSKTNFTVPGGFKFTNASGTAPPAMVHAAVGSAACSSCHAQGKTWAGTPATKVEPANHIPIGSTVCTNCHSASNFTSFVIANAVPPMNHAGFTSGCATCHGAGKTDVGTTPKVTVTLPSNHVPIGSVACEGCHSNSAFSTFSFTNASGTAPSSMVHSLVSSTACSTCHEAGKTWVGTPATKVRPALKADGTAHVATGECSTCHFNTTSFKGATDLPPNHIPLPTADANNCALCHTTGVYSAYVMNHVNITTNCAQCHATGKSFANIAPPALVQPPSNHVPFGSAACESCHSNTSFATGGFKFTNASGTAPPAMVHAAVSSASCASCHGLGLSWAGTPATKVEPSNHIPIGSTPCTNCHSASNFTSFVIANAVPPMNHAGFTSGCATCHGAGKTDVGKTPKVTVTLPSNHVPIGSVACEGCHSNSAFSTFSFTNASGTAPSSMVHSLVSSTACSTCHEKGKSWVGTPATKVRPALKADGTAHAATGECSTCHFNTTSFKGATDLPANHIPLPAADNNNCALCHTTGDYSVYVMNHANITSNCMQCHAYGLSFANMAPPTLKQPPAGATGHIPTNPPNSSSQNFACELCHLPTVFTSFSGTVMKHAVVRGMTCMSCHEYGMTWKTNSGVRLWVRDGKNHHAGQDCGGSGCHSTRDKYAARGASAASAAQKTSAAGAAPALSAAASVGGGAVGFSHRRVAGTACVSCHGPTSGIGKSADHLATSDRCESCHMTIAWSPVTHVDHMQVLGSCVSCHNGVAATGRNRNHIAASDSCETCHTTNAWLPARFDHIGVAAHTCKTCHDSIHATGLPASHVPTSAQCDTCHGTLGWKPARLDHTTLTATCASCHDNHIALGVTPTHMVTARDCATCHSYPDWSVLHFVHTTAAYPGDHRTALACAACHKSNTDQIPWASPADAGSCGGCHASDFRPDLHPKSLDGLKYTASELRNCTGACHVYSNATLDKIAKPMPGPYHRVMDAAFRH